MNYGWHRVDPLTHRYYLVEVLAETTTHTHIKYLHNIFTVSSTQILPHEPHKPTSLLKLKYPSTPEVNEFLTNTIKDSKSLIKVNNRLTLALPWDPLREMETYLEYTLRRLIISQRKKQYMYLHQGSNLDSLCSGMQCIESLWPHKAKLSSLYTILHSLFEQFPLHLKMQITYESVSRITLQSLPIGDTQQAEIFRLMREASLQIKMYFKIPLNTQETNNSHTLSKLVDALLQFGLTVIQIEQIMHGYAFIMNLRQAQFELKNGFKFKRNTQLHGNMISILGEALYHTLEDSLNYSLNGQSLPEQEEVKRHINILCQALFEQVTTRAVTILNDLLGVANGLFHKQYILMSIPRGSTQESIAQSQLNIMNENIVKMAFQEGNETPSQEMQWRHLFKQLQKEYQSEVNNHLLEREYLIHRRFVELKESSLLRDLLERTVGKGKVTDMEQRMEMFSSAVQAQKGQAEYFNYIVKIHQPLDRLLEKRVIALLTSKKKETKECSNRLQPVQLSPNQASQEEQLVDIGLDKFCGKYLYTPTLKNLYTLHPKRLPIKQLVTQLIQTQKSNWRLTGNILSISEQTLLSLTQELQELNSKANIIKKQLKTHIFRSKIHRNLHPFILRVRGCKSLKIILQGPMRQFLRLMRYRTGIMKVENAGNLCLNRVKKSGVQLILKVGRISKAMHKLRKYRKLSILKSMAFRKLLVIYRVHRMVRTAFRYELNRKRDIFSSLSNYFQIIVRKPPQVIPIQQLQQPPQDNQQSPIQPVQQLPPIQQTQPIPQQHSRSKDKKSAPPEPVSQSQHLSPSDGESYRSISKSETSKAMTRMELLNIKDCPLFSFDTWRSATVGFQKSSADMAPLKEIFSSYSLQKQQNQDAVLEVEVDIFIKEKVVLHPFSPYLSEHIARQNDSQLESLLSHSSKLIKSALLKEYPAGKYPNSFAQSFNALLKIGKDKNTTKKLHELINIIVRPIRDSFKQEKKSVSTVFEEQLPIVTGYTWDHNIIKDEVFLQMIKQLILAEESLLPKAFEIITRYYYPSPQFLYHFLHYLKSIQSKNINHITEAFLNSLLFAQAYEGYKGTYASVMKAELRPTEREAVSLLQYRNTEIAECETADKVKIEIRLVNQEKYTFPVRNQILHYFKRRLLKKLNILDYETEFELYFVAQMGLTAVQSEQNSKAIDFVINFKQEATKNILYLRMRNYFPFNPRQTNILRLAYLNCLSEQKNLPWQKEKYEDVVVIGMYFSEFQQIRISNYLLVSGQQKQEDIDLAPIKAKFSSLLSNKPQMASELAYFKLVKDCGFLLAKAYKYRAEEKEDLLKGITKIVIKPLQLCFYQQTTLLVSISITKIKSIFFQKGEICLGILLDELKYITIKNPERVNELYNDIVQYTEYLIPKN